MEVRQFSYNGKKILYRVKGNGPAVVMLHGFGEDGRVWEGQYDIFPGRQLVIPDLPGSGGSERIDDMSMEGIADAIKILLDEVSGSDPLIVIGHSMGGYITLAFAEKYPVRLKAFGLFHSTAYADTEDKKENRRKGVRFMNEHGAYEFLKTVIPNLYSAETKQNRPELSEQHVHMMRNANTEANVNYYEAMMQRPDRTIVLINSRVPILFVLGKYDTAVPLEDGLKLCHLPQLAYIHVLQQSGHMGMIEENKESNKILSQFVTTIETIA